MPKSPKQKKGRSVFHACAILVLFMIVVVIFDSEDLDQWARKNSSPLFQETISPAIDSWHRLMQKIGLAQIRSAVREDIFVPIRDAHWSRNSVALSGSVDVFGPGASAIAAKLRENPSLLSQKPAFDASHPLSILVMGDSMAAGLADDFIYQLRSDKWMSVTKLSKVSSTLSDPIYFDWLGNLPGIFDIKRAEMGKTFDVIVVFLGGNDAQSIFVNHHELEFFSEEWLAEFKSRAHTLLSLINKNGRQVYWVGLPPMRPEAYSGRMARMAGLYQELCSEYPKFKFIPTTGLFGDENGNYTLTKTIGGRQTILRVKDGIHLSDGGSHVLFTAVWSAICARNDIAGHPAAEVEGQ